MPSERTFAGSWMALIASGCGAMVATTASGQTSTQQYLLTAVARTGDSDLCYGVPRLSTFTNMPPAIDRAGSAAVRFFDTGTQRDGVVRWDARAGSAGVVFMLGAEQGVSRSLDQGAGLLALGRPDVPGRLEVRTCAGDPVRVFTDPVGPSLPERVTLGGSEFVAATVIDARTGSRRHLLWSLTAPPSAPDGDRVIGVAGERAILALGPGSVNARGDMVSYAVYDDGPAVMAWGLDGGEEVRFSAGAAPVAAISPLTAVNDAGQIAAAVQRWDGVWELVRLDPSGAVVTLATGWTVLPAGTLDNASIASRTPAINNRGEAAIVARDDTGTAVYLCRAGTPPLRVAGNDDVIQTRDGLMRAGLGTGVTRQVIISDPAMNDFGEVAFVVRLRDGTTALVVAAPVRARECPADFDEDGVLTADDLSDFITAFFSPGGAVAADFNRDERRDADDLSDYITAYFAGCGE